MSNKTINIQLETTKHRKFKFKLRNITQIRKCPLTCVYNLGDILKERINIPLSLLK